MIENIIQRSVSWTVMIENFEEILRALEMGLSSTRVGKELVA